METNYKNKIEATDTSINSLLKDQKFYIDYFQREYRWQDKHIKLLIEDLTNAFLKSYNPGDPRTEVANYQSYFLGPVVFNKNPKTQKKSIIDGQQRITSITLLLIYLNHLQKNHSSSVEIGKLIFSEKYGEKSFNMTDETREPCLSSLFDIGSYQPTEDEDETVINMVERYADIDQVFPEELIGEALPYFIDWLIENVVIVQITAYSDENAYTIFETMNDRGLNLTPTEMLKGYVLSKITDPERREELNELWKSQIQELHRFGETADQSFFQAWFRGKYAEAIRPGKAGSQNQDFELIGTRFHNWFKENHTTKFNLQTTQDFYDFFKKQFPFFVKWYVRLLENNPPLIDKSPHLEYIKYSGIAESLQDPLLLASIRIDDENEIIERKLDWVARFIETFTSKRAVNYRKSGQTTIKYTMFNIMKKIRNEDILNMGEVLREEVERMEQTWEEGINEFGLHGQNRKFVKHLLARITLHLDQLVGKDTSYGTYQSPKGKPFEIEHLWGDKFDEHRDEFEQEGDFQKWRNSIGALILLPNGTNQSFSSDSYDDKIDHYLRENTYAQTLHSGFYIKNPNFLKSDLVQQIGFESHEIFKKDDIQKRKEVVLNLCEQIWDTSYFTLSKSSH